jgi:hypothetical protein
MDEEHIHLQLVAHPNQQDTPTQIMEADEDEDVNEMGEAKSVYAHNMEMRESDRLKKQEILHEGDHDDNDFHHVEEASMAHVNHEEKVVPDVDVLETFHEDEEASQDSTYNKIPEDAKRNEEPISDEFFGPAPLRTEDRVSHLELQMKRSKSRLDGFSQELKVLLVEVNIVSEWITENFGKFAIYLEFALFTNDFDVQALNSSTKLPNCSSTFTTLMRLMRCLRSCPC